MRLGLALALSLVCAVGCFPAAAEPDVDFVAQHRAEQALTDLGAKIEYDDDGAI